MPTPEHIERLRAESRRPINEDEGPDLERLGTLLRTLRNEACLSRRLLGLGSEVGTSHIERLEEGTRRTRLSTLKRIADALADGREVDATDLYERLVEAAGPAIAPEANPLHQPRIDRLRRIRAAKARRKEARRVELKRQESMVRYLARKRSRWVAK